MVDTTIMDIQTEKLYLIEQVAKLQDVNIIQQLKEILRSTSENHIVGYNSDENAITQIDLIDRAKASNLAIEKGKTKSISEIRSNMKNW